MGHGYTGKCKDCGHESRVNNGGGFVFHLLHCERCGREKRIGFEKFLELHKRYVKGLGGPWTIFTMDFDKSVQDDPTIEPISRDEYFEGISLVAGKCRCRGRYRMDAPPRCPKCRSTSLEHTEGLEIMYD